MFFLTTTAAKIYTGQYLTFVGRSKLAQRDSFQGIKLSSCHGGGHMNRISLLSSALWG